MEKILCVFLGLALMVVSAVSALAAQGASVQHVPGMGALSPRIGRLQERALDHDVFPSPVKVEYDPADEKLPEPVRIGKRLCEYMSAQSVAIRADELDGVEALDVLPYVPYGIDKARRLGLKVYEAPQPPPEYGKEMVAKLTGFTSKHVRLP